MFDLLNIQPHEVSTNLSEYVICLLGSAGVGKTTTALGAPRVILGAAEMGYKSIPGTVAAPLKTWTDVLSFTAQLKKPDVKEKFQTVVLDSIGPMVDMAEEFICAANGVRSIGEIPWGQGYSQLGTAFKKVFREIINNGYGLIIIAHPAIKQDENNPDLKYATLGLNKKVKDVLLPLFDIMVYIEGSRDASARSIMHFKGTPYWEAKSRFPNIVESAELSYANLQKAVNDAVGSFATTSEHRFTEEKEEKVSKEQFLRVQEEALALATEKIEKVGQAPVMTEISTTLFKKISECDIADFEPLKLLIERLSSL
jgi:hypothetical protein